MTLDPRRLHYVAPGFYKVRLVKGGPWVPVHVWETGERDEETGEPLEDIDSFIEVNGAVVPFEKADFHAERINLHGVPIDRAEFEYRRDTRRWAEAYAPDVPEARPQEAIDLNKVPPIF